MPVPPLLNKWWNRVTSYRPLNRAGNGCGACYRRLERYWEQMTGWLGKGSRSIANRILALQFTWALVVYILVIAALWFATSLVIEKSFRNQGEGWVAKLDELGTPLYASENPGRLGELISDLHKFPEIASVRYYTGDGSRVIASYTKTDAPDPDLPALTPAELKALRDANSVERPMHYEEGKGRQLRITSPIRIKSIPRDGMLDFSLESEVKEKIEVIGYVSVLLDYSHFYDDLNRTLRNASIVIAVLMLFAAVVGRVLIRWALTPLSQLEEPLTRLANGETDVQVESSGDREIAQIGMALNTTIGALRERDETLRQMANHDALTGLANRSHFSEQLDAEVAAIGEHGGSSALFFIDLDRFKYINDSYGHAAGDQLLIQVAELLQHRMREDDIVARFGGDEFTAIIKNVSRKKAGDIAQSLLQLMNDYRFHVDEEVLKIQFSIGVTLIEGSEATAHDYMLQADEAVHKAKAEGRNRYHFFVPNQDAAEEMLHTGWHARLSEAIARDELSLFYQPLLNLHGQDGLMYEVLLRLPDSNSGVIPPGAFFPAAERFGLMAELDRQVMRKALAALGGVKEERCVLSINLSEQMFEDEGLVDYLQGLFGKYGVDTGDVIFEVGERLAIRAGEPVKRQFEQIRGMGCSLAIDDFGAGYATFQYLKHSPFNYVKIDSALIANISQEPVDRIAVEAIAQSAAALGIKTVAKFVPDAETVTLLQSLGVDYAQGNYLGEPGPGLCSERTLPRLKLVE